jgi:hypothetical protein
MLVRKATKPTISHLMVRLVASSIDMALDEDVGLEGDSTYDDTFAIRQRELLVTRFSLGESKREMEGVEMAMAATPSSSLFELLSSRSSPSSEEYSSRIMKALGFLVKETLASPGLEENDVYGSFYSCRQCWASKSRGL